MKTFFGYSGVSKFMIGITRIAESMLVLLIPIFVLHFYEPRPEPILLTCGFWAYVIIQIGVTILFIEHLNSFPVIEIDNFGLQLMVKISDKISIFNTKVVWEDIIETKDSVFHNVYFARHGLKWFHWLYGWSYGKRIQKGFVIPHNIDDYENLISIVNSKINLKGVVQYRQD